MKTVNINTFSVQNSLNVDTRGMRRNWASVDQFLSFQPSTSRYNPTFDRNYPSDWGLPKVILSPTSPTEEANNRTVISVPSSITPPDKIPPVHVQVRADDQYPDMEHEYSQIPSLTVTALDHYYESLPSLVNPSLTTHINIRQNNATDVVNNAKENSLVSKRFHSLPVLDCIDYPGESEI